MENSPLGKLAPELRNDIYERVFEATECLTLVRLNGHGAIVALDSNGARRALALTQTCKEMRTETLQMFYGTTAFEIVPLLASNCLGHWSKAVSAEYSRSLIACRDWLQRVGRKPAHAISRLVIRHGGGNIWDSGNMKRPTYWWNDARKVEKRVLHKDLSPSSVHVKFSINSFDCGITRHTSTDSGPNTCHLDVLHDCSFITYELPTGDKKVAAAEAERIVKAKLQRLEAEAKEFDCCVGVLLPQLKTGVEKCHAVVMTALGKE